MLVRLLLLAFSLFYRALYIFFITLYPVMCIDRDRVGEGTTISIINSAFNRMLIMNVFFNILRRLIYNIERKMAKLLFY